MCDNKGDDDKVDDMYLMKMRKGDGKDNNSDKGCLLTGHLSMRAKATRFTPESITAKLNFTYESVESSITF